MIKINISIIGDKYTTEQMLVDTVEACHGFYIVDSQDFVHIYSTGDEFRGGKIIDCFVHPESDCVFMVVECDGVYFDVYFDNYKKYDIQWIPLPFT